MRTLIVMGVVLIAGCSNKLEGSVQLDGAQYTAVHCNSGVSFGFAGVQFDDAGGRRVRVVNDPVSGSVKVALFAPGATKGDDLGACATLNQHPQTSNINGVQNQEGTVAFNCDGGGHKLSGTLNFKNCH